MRQCVLDLDVCIIGFWFFWYQQGLAGAAIEGELIGTWATMFPAWVLFALPPPPPPPPPPL